MSKEQVHGIAFGVRYYALIKRGFIKEDESTVDSSLMTFHTDLNEIYWFKGKHNYCSDYYYIVEIERDTEDTYIEIEHTELDK